MIKVTYDELLSKIDSYLIPTKAHLEEPNFAVNTLQALRAVVELHRPSWEGCAGCDDRCGCSEGDWGGKNTWETCPTIQAIEKELL